MPFPFRKSRATAMAALLLVTCVSGAQAEVKKIEPSDKKLNETNPVANIFYFGNVNQHKIKDLSSTIDEINIRYTTIKKINLYINSGGGDMDSGFIAYWTVKSSPIPIAAVNLSVVGSAATMMFCASSERVSIKGGRFILHPAAVVVGNKDGSYQPNNLMRLQQNLVGFNKMFSDIYKTCTNYKPDEIATILSSEDSRKFIFEDEAKERGIITGTTDKIIPASLVYYITDSSSSK